jgi:hypothetical protein
MREVYKQTHDSAGNEYGKLEKLDRLRLADDLSKVATAEADAHGFNETQKALTLTTLTLSEVLDALNAAIDRINELEARFENHYHTVDIGNDMTDGPEQFASRDTHSAKGDCSECQGTGLIGTDVKGECSNCVGTGKAV